MITNIKGEVDDDLQLTGRFQEAVNEIIESAQRTTESKTIESSKDGESVRNHSNVPKIISPNNLSAKIKLKQKKI